MTGLSILVIVAWVPPAQAANGDVANFYGPAGIPVNPQCSPDGEIAGAQGSEMFFPHAGCRVEYDPQSYGIIARQSLAMVYIDYRVTGHVGEICGQFFLEGRIVGNTPRICTPHDQRVRVAVQGTQASTDDEYIILSWHNFYGYDNAYLLSFTVQEVEAPGADPDPDPDPTPPEEPCMLTALGECITGTPPCVVGFTTDCTIIIPNMEGVAAATCKATAQKTDIIERQTGQPSPIDTKTCNGDDVPCLVGPESCLVPIGPGCQIACDLYGDALEAYRTACSTAYVVAGLLPGRPLGSGNCGIDPMEKVPL